MQARKPAQPSQPTQPVGHPPCWCRWSCLRCLAPLRWGPLLAPPQGAADPAPPGAAAALQASLPAPLWLLLLLPQSAVPPQLPVPAWQGSPPHQRQAPPPAAAAVAARTPLSPVARCCRCCAPAAAAAGWRARPHCRHCRRCSPCCCAAHWPAAAACRGGAAPAGRSARTAETEPPRRSR
jgi:hypothetical protein